MAAVRCYPTFAIEQEGAPQAAISTKACENLGEGCVARSDFARGHLWFKVHLSLKAFHGYSTGEEVSGRWSLGGMGLGRAELGQGVGCSRCNTKWHILT